MLECCGINDMAHLDIKVFGRVQGVFFRDSARMKAEELGLAGFARNEPDGSVYIEAEGEEDALKEFLAWCGKGPEFAKVTKVESAPGQEKYFRGFLI